AGKAAVVTGGARGIGAAIARLFAAAGARGAVLDLATAADAPPGWTGVAADVGDEASLRSAFRRVEAELGAVDVLVAAAGIVAPWSRVGCHELAEWDEAVAVHARWVAATLLYALPLMEE